MPSGRPKKGGDKDTCVEKDKDMKTRQKKQKTDKPVTRNSPKKAARNQEHSEPDHNREGDVIDPMEEGTADLTDDEVVDGKTLNTEDNDRHIIRFMEDHPEYYDKSNSKYVNSKLKRVQMKELTTQLEGIGWTVKAIETRWKSLRTDFRKIRKEVKTTKSGQARQPLTHKKQYKLDMMAFIEPFQRGAQLGSTMGGDLSDEGDDDDDDETLDERLASGEPQPSTSGGATSKQPGRGKASEKTKGAMWKTGVSKGGVSKGPVTKGGISQGILNKALEEARTNLHQVAEQIENAVAAPDEQGNQRVTWGKFLMSVCMGIPRENFRAFQTGSFELSMRYVHPNVDQPQPPPPTISTPRLSTSSSFLASPPRPQTHPAVVQHPVQHFPVSSLPPQPQYQMQYQQQQQPQYQQRQYLTQHQVSQQHLSQQQSCLAPTRTVSAPSVFYNNTQPLSAQDTYGNLNSGDFGASQSSRPSSPNILHLAASQSGLVQQSSFLSQSPRPSGDTSDILATVQHHDDEGDDNDNVL